MYLYATLKWGVAWVVITGVDRWSDGLSLGVPHQAIPIAFILSIIGLWLDRWLIPGRTSTTAATADLFVYSSVFYGLQYFFPLFYVNTNTALTVGLLLAATEIFFHPLFPFPAGKKRQV